MDMADIVYDNLKDRVVEISGLECYRFKVGTYNKCVATPFKLPYDDNALGVLILSTPSFFESSFKHWLLKQRFAGEKFEDFMKRVGCSPLEAYFQELFGRLRKDLEPEEVEILHDFDVLPNGRPKVLMNVCGHVAGAAYYYQPKAEIVCDNLPQSKKRKIGLSLHEKYGGHFAFRGTFIFRSIHLAENFVEQTPAKVLKATEEQQRAIDFFNSSWKDGRFRDFGSPVERYSDNQLLYFSLLPKERWHVIASWFSD